MNYDEPEFIDDGDEDLRPLKTPPQLSLTKNTHVGRKHRYTKRYYYRDRKPFINCSNCEGNGHLFKDCKKPIQSFGILAWTLKPNTLKETSLQSPLQSTTLSVCLIQRRHTISFEAFVRGKYDVDELQMHSERMTISEKKAILETDWDTLYDGVMNTKHALTNNTAELKQKQNVFTLRERDRAKLLYNSVDLKKLFGSDQSGVLIQLGSFLKDVSSAKKPKKPAHFENFKRKQEYP